MTTPTNRRNINNMDIPLMRVADLFSGCGGLSQGFIDAGFDVVVAIEKWEAARKVYSQNFDHPVLDLDLENVDLAVSTLKQHNIQMIVGGPPCQDFSAAGTRSEGDRAKLTISFAKTIAALRPQWFVFENVPEAKNSLAWSSAKKILFKAGYGITECILNAAYFHVPQSRKRFFAIGRCDEDDHFLEEVLLRRLRPTMMTVRDHVGDTFGIDFYYRHPRNWGRKAIFSLDEPSATIRSTNRPVPPGYSAHENDAGPLDQARPLNTNERARIQTFPEDFQFSGNNTERDMMIANAVPVALARHVATVILNHEQRRTASPAVVRFHSWLTEVKQLTPRTANDVISRLKRALRILGVNTLTTTSDCAISTLSKKLAFQKLPGNIKTQLKRAISLQHEFKMQNAAHFSMDGTDI